MSPEQFSDWLEQQNQSQQQTTFQKPLIMGVLNVTSDSFYDGGHFLSMDRACEQAFNLIAQGADIIDIGAESTKPGAVPVDLERELSRVIPLIKQIRSNSDVCISIDTYKPEVMEAAVQAGANIINDIYALTQERALEVAVALDVPVCLMHMQGTPQNMQINPIYPDGVVNEVMRFFSARIEVCDKAGMKKKNIILDPGFGFGKRVHDNLNLIHLLKCAFQYLEYLQVFVSEKYSLQCSHNKCDAP